VISVAEKRLPSSVPVLRRALLWGLVANAGIAIIGGALGALVAGSSGAVSAVIGAAMGFVFLGLTAASMLIAVRFSMVAFFGIVMGTWILKFVLFLVLAFVLRAQPWVSLLALFLALIASVLVSLVVDVVAVAKSRMPYASDVVLPGEDSTGR
jgi:membrane associated rhomboid family serine protease